MNYILDTINMVKEGRFGFKIDEIMTGWHRFEKGKTSGKRFMEFRVTWGPESVRKWLNPIGKDFLTQKLKGTVTVEGLCQNTPCEGTLELNYFDEHIIRYTFEFKVKNKAYIYVGEKVNIQLWNLPVSHTTCFGRITEKTTGKLVSTSVTYFKLSTALKFLMSLRLG